MGKPKPWWGTHPREYWTAVDYAAARRAGVVPLPQPDVDPAIALIAATTPKAASLAGGLWGDADASRAAQRRRRVNLLLKAHGCGPLRHTW